MGFIEDAVIEARFVTNAERPCLVFLGGLGFNGRLATATNVAWIGLKVLLSCKTVDWQCDYCSYASVEACQFSCGLLKTRMTQTWFKTMTPSFFKHSRESCLSMLFQIIHSAVRDQNKSTSWLRGIPTWKMVGFVVTWLWAPTGGCNCLFSSRTYHVKSFAHGACQEMIGTSRI